MRDRTISLIAACCALLFATVGSTAPKLEPGFERLKTLIGTWDVVGSERHVVYYLTGGDVTLVEEFKGEPTMASFYHMDGDQLMLTHYCNAGNQPRMTAVDYNADLGVLRFQFLDVTNLQTATAYHTRDLAIRFMNEDDVELTFTGLKEGETVESTIALRRRSE